MSKTFFDIPKEIIEVAEKMKDAGFEFYAVGGCVRNKIMQKEINDWDFTTNATPEDIQKIFPHTVYENNFYTVGVVLDNATEKELKVIEITSYRKESKYTDGRRPDKIEIAKKLEDDLSRRDFTINALALDPITKELIDLYDGVKDLNKGIIRTIGDPIDRFSEDYLRMLRAIRIASQLNGVVEEKTLNAIKENANKIEGIAKERVRDEMIKILECENGEGGFNLLKDSGILKFIIPELLEGVGVEQNQAHMYDVFNHNIKTLAHSIKIKTPLYIKLSALFHDIGKPATREWNSEKGDWTFYNHEIVGAKMAKKIMQRLKFSKNLTDIVVMFVRWHMFFSDVEKVTLSGVRRMISRVGEKYIWDLIELRKCDRIGTGRPKEQPYRLRKYISMVDEALTKPISPSMLNINGEVLMKKFNIPPSRKIGNILDILLIFVLDDPKNNTKEALLKKAEELILVKEEELNRMGDVAKIKKMEENQKQIDEIRAKYFVK